MDCLFCKIIKGEIPCYKIYEDENTFAFLDIADDFLGHTLVVPKAHTPNIFEAKEETINAVMKTIKKLSKHYVEDCGFDGVNVFNNNGECAEQSVHHLHFHIIPRKNGDEIKMYAKQPKKNSDFSEIQNTLKLK